MHWYPEIFQTLTREPLRVKANVLIISPGSLTDLILQAPSTIYDPFSTDINTKSVIITYESSSSSCMPSPGANSCLNQTEVFAVGRMFLKWTTTYLMTCEKNATLQLCGPNTLDIVQTEWVSCNIRNWNKRHSVLKNFWPGHGITTIIHSHPSKTLSQPGKTLSAWILTLLYCAIYQMWMLKYVVLLAGCFEQRLCWFLPLLINQENNHNILCTVVHNSQRTGTRTSRNAFLGQFYIHILLYRSTE